jgi:hypothetical protein
MLLFCAEVVGAECPFNEEEAQASLSENPCLNCHSDYSSVINKSLHSKRSKFIEAAFGDIDEDFEKKNCGGCHINSCFDCHKKAEKPDSFICLECHRGIGADYFGYGARDFHKRFRRGISINGEYFMKMLPDIHSEKLSCGDCHTMSSLSGGKAKECLSCHDYSIEVIDHRIAEHKNITCAACHAGWSSNIYGLHFVRLRGAISKSNFSALKQLNEEYAVSAHFVFNESLILGKDLVGRYVPIRPFIAFFSDTAIVPPKNGALENVLVSNLWKPFRPHTIRRETLTCGSCHNNRRKYLLEDDSDRIFLLEKDGLPIPTFHNSRYFSIADGEFVNEEDYKRLSEKSSEYVKFYLLKLKEMTGAW